jgi:hypothetical protein
MGRWIAIGTAPGWNDIAKLTVQMKATPMWRPAPRTTITSVIALADGRLVAECHAVAQADFEDWLRLKGWDVESVTPINCVARTGEVWKIT